MLGNKYKILQNFRFFFCMLNIYIRPRSSFLIILYVPGQYDWLFYSWILRSIHFKTTLQVASGVIRAILERNVHKYLVAIRPGRHVLGNESLITFFQSQNNS